MENKLILVKPLLALLGYFNAIFEDIKGTKTLTLTVIPSHAFVNESDIQSIRYVLDNKELLRKEFIRV